MMKFRIRQFAALCTLGLAPWCHAAETPQRYGHGSAVSDPTSPDAPNYAICLSQFNKLEKGQVLAGVCNSLCESQESFKPSSYLESQILKPLMKLVKERPKLLEQDIGPSQDLMELENSFNNEFLVALDRGTNQFRAFFMGLDPSLKSTDPQKGFKVPKIEITGITNWLEGEKRQTTIFLKVGLNSFSITTHDGGQSIDRVDLAASRESRQFNLACDASGEAGTTQNVMSMTKASAQGHAGQPISGDSVIRANVFGSPLKIRTTSRLAGAIGSLTWKGKEFVNQDDHGRELQSASSFDGLGECFNPTEAGSDADGEGPTSSSKLLSINADRNRLNTTVQMAFWWKPNASYPDGCGDSTTLKKSQNTTVLSNHKLSKQVTIGFEGIPNVIEYLVSYEVPEAYKKSQFEAFAGYLTKDFSSFWTFEPDKKSLKKLGGVRGEQSRPVVLSTPDKRYAMGVYSPELPQEGINWGKGAGYGRRNYASYDTMKLNTVFRLENAPAGTYNYKVYVVVGNLEQVKRGMVSVHEHFYPEQK